MIEGAGGAVVVDAPDFIQKRFAGNGVAAFAKEHRQHFHFARAQFDRSRGRVLRSLQRDSDCLESFVEILVRSDPDPVGLVAGALTDCAIASAETDGPIRIGTLQFLETKARMVGVLGEEQESFAGLGTGFGRKCVVERPELLRPARNHKVEASRGFGASSASRDFSAQLAKRAIRSGS